MENWYLQKGDQRFGPMTLDALKEMVAAGQVAPNDLVWTTGMASWLPANTQAWYFSPESTPTSISGPYSSEQGSIYGGQSYAATPPPSLTGWSVAVIFFCCLPGGIVALIYSNKAKKQWALGNFTEAQEAHKTAKTTLIVSAIAGCIISLIYIVLAIGQK
ncbi:CD225/dispanin family protein [Acidicapsa ligni]|uniref:CD225/dispanin family protein n=1 Tax=Acidicapsa ligni TaxID=542300 RepID=UPI0021E00A45|nr:CD225/dispanin family protein [Acidicapsa ligni]